jgi:single-strand DNA-binding protein
MNKHCSTGRLVADPELKLTPQNGTPVCSFTLAVKRPNVKDTTDFLNYVAWTHTAEYLCKYGKKGDMVEVTGVLTSRNYEDSNGNKRTAFEVRVDDLRLISGGSSATEQSVSQTPNSLNTAHSGGNTGNIEASFEEISTEDDLPF